MRINVVERELAALGLFLALRSVCEKATFFNLKKWETSRSYVSGGR